LRDFWTSACSGYSQCETSEYTGPSSQHFVNPIVGRKVSKEFLELTKLRSVWDLLLHNHVLHQNIPLPGLGGKSYDELTATEMETGLRRALKLRRNWISESPLISKQFNLRAIPDSRIVSLHVLPGYGHRRLLSLSFEQSRVFTLQCWDIAASPPVCIARRAFRRLGGMAVNISLTGIGVVAVRNPKYVVEIPNAVHSSH
jgi:hypothetical protein